MSDSGKWNSEDSQINETEMQDVDVELRQDGEGEDGGTVRQSGAYCCGVSVKQFERFEQFSFFFSGFNIELKLAVSAISIYAS